MRRVETRAYALMEIIIKSILNQIIIFFPCLQQQMVCFCIVLYIKKNQTKQTAFKRRGERIASLYRDDISVTQIT